MKNNNKSKHSEMNEVQESLVRLSGILERFSTLSDDVLTMLRTANIPDKDTVSVAKPVSQIRYNLQTSEISNKPLESIIEKPIEIVDSKIGCFDILSALVKQFPKKITVSAPKKRQDGSWGKLYQLNIPRIDETFSLIDQSLPLNDRKNQAKEMWKIFALRSGYIFTTRSGGEWKHFISLKTEEEMLSWLKTNGVHIPIRYPDEKKGEQ